MKYAKLTAALCVATILSACTEPDGSPARGVMNGGAPSKQEIGTVAGVVGGGLIGSAFGSGTGQALAIVGGALLGGVLGNVVGGNMDDADRAAYERASQRAMNTGSTQTWRNSESGHRGSVTPGKRYTNDAGNYCRAYTQKIVIEGKTHTGHGTACRDDDGTWRIVE
jgi:surface antigen